MSKKVLALLSFSVVIFAFLDTNLQLLKDLGLTTSQGNWIKLVGLIIASLTPKITNLFTKDELSARPEDDGKEKDKDGAVVPTKGF